MDLKESDIGKVFLGENSKCKVKGIGKVKLVLHDGLENTLTGVRSY